MSQHTVDTITISFPELDLPTRAGHHLRGYFGTLFRDRSPLIHNHYADGTLRYAYPLVQYKVVAGVPALLGLGEGAGLLAELFLEVHEIEMEGRIYPLREKRLESATVAVGVSDELLRYRFEGLWMALNQENHRRYLDAEAEGRAALLDRTLRNQILAVFKGIGVWLMPEERVFAKAELAERQVNFKNQRMLVFAGNFTTNALLPPLIGIGKSVSRGFGTVVPVRPGIVSNGDARQRGFHK